MCPDMGDKSVLLSGRCLDRVAVSIANPRLERCNALTTRVVRRFATLRGSAHRAVGARLARLGRHGHTAVICIIGRPKGSPCRPSCDCGAGIACRADEGDALDVKG